MNAVWWYLLGVFTTPVLVAATGGLALRWVRNAADDPQEVDS